MFYKPLMLLRISRLWQTLMKIFEDFTRFSFFQFHFLSFHFVRSF